MGVAYPTFFRVSGEKDHFAPSVENAKFIGVDEGVSTYGRAEYFVPIVGIRSEAVGHEDDDFVGDGYSSAFQICAPVVIRNKQTNVVLARTFIWKFKYWSHWKVIKIHDGPSLAGCAQRKVYELNERVVYGGIIRSERKRSNRRKRRTNKTRYGSRSLAAVCIGRRKAYIVASGRIEGVAQRRTVIARWRSVDPPGATVSGRDRSVGYSC